MKKCIDFSLCLYYHTRACSEGRSFGRNDRPDKATGWDACCLIRLFWIFGFIRQKYVFKTERGFIGGVAAAESKKVSGELGYVKAAGLFYIT